MRAQRLMVLIKSDTKVPPVESSKLVAPHCTPYHGHSGNVSVDESAKKNDPSVRNL